MNILLTLNHLTPKETKIIIKPIFNVYWSIILGWIHWYLFSKKCLSEIIPEFPLARKFELEIFVNLNLTKMHLYNKQKCKKWF